MENDWSYTLSEGSKVICCFYVSIHLLEPFLTLDLNKNNDESMDVAAGSGEMFDKIAKYYDSANTVMSLGNDDAWRRKLVDSVKLDNSVYISGLHTTIPIKHALDIATGTGEVAILLGQKAREMKLNLTIIGLDPSAEMLHIAEDKTSNTDLKDMITYRHDDVLNMPSIFHEDMFQIVTISFGIRNVNNYTQALIEIKRVLSSFGSVYILEFSAPSSRSWLSPIKHVFLHHVLPIIGKVKSGGKAAEYQHLADSIYKFPSPDQFQAAMEAVGFVQCSHEDIFHDVVYLYKCSVGNKNECTAGQTCESMDGTEQVEVDTSTAVPNPNNMLIVPDNVEVEADVSTMEAVATDETAPPTVTGTESAEGGKIKKKGIKRKKKLIKE